MGKVGYQTILAFMVLMLNGVPPRITPVLTYFKGDGDQREILESKAETTQLQPSVNFHSMLPFVVAQDRRLRPLAVLHNPLEGESAAKQLSESVENFVERLRPSESTSGFDGPWIWAANPHVEHHPVKQDLAGLSEQAGKLLREYDSFRILMQRDMPGKVPSVIGRKLTPKRKELEANLRKTALEHKVTSGKWMLFPSFDRLDYTWKCIVQATVENRLGTMAKVATASTGRDQNVRPIFVYTRDFSDVEDVKRVLDELVNLNLVKKDSEKGIWYKYDSYSHLGIENGNEYGLRASMCGSKDFLEGKK